MQPQVCQEGCGQVGGAYGCNQVRVPWVPHRSFACTGLAWGRGAQTQSTAYGAYETATLHAAATS